MKATQQLMDEHESIKIVLSAMETIYNDLENKVAFDTLQFEKIIDFIKVFADINHHGKEEELLFPALEKKGFSHDSGPVRVMVNEHQIGRSYIIALTEAVSEYKNGDKKVLENIISLSRDSVTLLRNHIEKENKVLFPMADQVLDPEESNMLFDAFEKIGEERMGTVKHKEYITLVEDFRSTFLANNLKKNNFKIEMI